MKPRRERGRRALAGSAFAVLAMALLASPSSAQLEVLLRGLEPHPPKVGACGRYRFHAEEPSGRRDVEFEACVEAIEPGPDGSVILRLSSGDSVNARLEVAPALFAGHGGSLLEHVRSIVEISGRDTTRIDGASLPGLDPAPPLPGARDSSLGGRDFKVGTRTVHSQGRRLHEENRSVKPIGDAQMTQWVSRDVESWSADAAPILGIVRAETTIQSERRLSKRVAGLPESGPKRWFYTLELLEIRSAKKSGR